jgi:hypothetical protein
MNSRRYGLHLDFRSGLKIGLGLGILIGATLRHLSPIVLGLLG